MNTRTPRSSTLSRERKLLDLQQTVADVQQALAATAIERDRAGGTAKAERDLLRRSGLLALAVPETFGGHGAPWPVTLDTVRAIAKVDSSVAHLYAFQHLMVASVILYGTPAQTERFLTETIEKTVFWGNALNPLDRRTKLTPDGDGFRLDGVKSFCSGATDSDLLLVSAHDPEGRLRILVVPTRRPGITILGDWDAIGQRQTDSGGATFDGVRVEADEILGPPGPFGDIYSGLRPLIAQAILATIYLGIAEGAFTEALAFSRGSSRPWVTSGVERAVDDPYLQHHYGELWVGLEAVDALARRAWSRLQASWEAGQALTPDDRGRTAVAIAAFKTTAAKTGLEVTSRVFDLAGARATAARFGLDRHWRNLRTHSLHDPVDYKLKEIGAWVLTDAWPTPSFYA